MARQTYDEALKYILASEGGYTNDKNDPGGPTNWGITIADARTYWKPNATADDVRRMPLSIAKDIYRKHYADPLMYDSLPPGVDYCVLDYGVNSGISRAAKVLQRQIGVPVDGKIGLVTITETLKQDAIELINDICSERLRFLRGLRTWSSFGRGWSRRVAEVRRHAIAMVGKYPVPKPPLPAVANAKPAPDAPSETVEEGAKAYALAEVNPLPKSRTIWGGIWAWITANLGSLYALKPDDKWSFIAFLIILVISGIGLFLVIRGRINLGKIIEEEAGQ